MATHWKLNEKLCMKKGSSEKNEWTLEKFPWYGKYDVETPFALYMFVDVKPIGSLFQYKLDATYFHHHITKES